MVEGVLTKDRRGFTLLEVIIALVILSFVILMMANTSGTFIRSVARNDLTTSAIQLAKDRIEFIQMDPDYAGLDTLYVGTESGFPGLAGFTRETIIRRVGGTGQATDHKMVTVTVTGPGLDQPISRSISVAAP